MKQMTMMALAACAAAMAGCKSIEVERHGQSLATVTDADGKVEIVRDAKGNPIVLDGGWCVDYFQHWNWQKFDRLAATAGAGVSVEINNYESGADSNLVSLVHTSLDGATKLVTAIGDAYVKIAGGGAQAETAMNVAGKVSKYFTAKGGDILKAKVLADRAGKKITVTDGSTSICCDDKGNCSDCEDCTDGSCTDTDPCAGGACTDTSATPVNICTGEPLAK